MLDASHQFQSSVRPQNVKHAHFEVDPELPLNPGDGAREDESLGEGGCCHFVGYVSWYAPHSDTACVRLRFSHVCSLETVPETGQP